jgi:DNA-binding FrmR family transcriptional regulator
MKRIEGQARGVQSMLEEGRDCEAVITQLSAIRAAVSKVAIEMITAYMGECLLDEQEINRDEALERARVAFMKFS